MILKWNWIGSLIALLLSIFLFNSKSIAQSEKPIGAVIELEGTVEVLHKWDKYWEELSLRSRIYEHDMIESKKASRGKILFSDESLFSIGEGTKLSILQQEFSEKGKIRNSIYKIFLGKVRVVVGKLSGERSEFIVETPTTLAAMRGTEFIVWVKSDEITEIVVLEGVIEVRNISEEIAESILLRENQKTIIETLRPPTPPVEVNPQELERLRYEVKEERQKGSREKTEKGVSLDTKMKSEIRSHSFLPQREDIPKEILPNTFEINNPQTSVINTPINMPGLRVPKEEKEPKPLPSPPFPPK